MLMESVRVVLAEFHIVLPVLMMRPKCLKFNVQLVVLGTQ